MFSGFKHATYDMAVVSADQNKEMFSFLIYQSKVKIYIGTKQHLHFSLSCTGTFPIAIW